MKEKKSGDNSQSESKKTFYFVKKKEIPLIIMNYISLFLNELILEVFGLKLNEDHCILHIDQWLLYINIKVYQRNYVDTKFIVFIKSIERMIEPIIQNLN